MPAAFEAASRNLAAPSSAPFTRILSNGSAAGVANGGHEYENGYDSFATVRNQGIRWGQPTPAKDIVLQGFDKAGGQIIRDYAIEIAVLTAATADAE